MCFKKDPIEQEQLEEETGPLPKQRRLLTKSIHSKAVAKREIDSGLELTKEGRNNKILTNAVQVYLNWNGKKLNSLALVATFILI